jgi:hypothetical protein
MCGFSRKAIEWASVNVVPPRNRPFLMPVIDPKRGLRPTRTGPDAVAFFEGLGVPDTVLDRGCDCEWRGLEAELDRFSAYGYGTATQRRFLYTPHPHLMWATPAEVLGENNGIERVRTALRCTLDAADRP